MRDPVRIGKIIWKLQEVWLQHPDLRLGQLMEWIYLNKNVGDQTPAFYMEDDKWEEILEFLLSK